MRIKPRNDLPGVLALAITAVCYNYGFSATIISDDFESYADTAAMTAVWSVSGTGGATLDTAFGNPGHSLNHSGTASTNLQNIAPVTPGPGETLHYQADIYDDGVANKRVTAGLRNTAPSNILEMGMYNDPIRYAFRIILFGSGNPNWVAFPDMVDDLGDPISSADSVVGWHRFSVDITDSSATFSLDLNSDGNINSTAVVPLTIFAGGFNQVRLGGPSNLSSAGGGANFDNVHLDLVPEPASIMLFGLGSVLAAAAVSRRARG